VPFIIYHELHYASMHNGHLIADGSSSLNQSFTGVIQLHEKVSVQKRKCFTVIYELIGVVDHLATKRMQASDENKRKSSRCSWTTVHNSPW
jgi:hypothetical protein